MTAEDDFTREARVRRWAAGVRLSDAWYAFGDERQKRLHDERRGDRSSLVFQENLIRSVFSDLANGDLLALGYRTKPTISDGPVPIPADAFTTEPNHLWREDKLKASGWHYVRIKVAIGSPPRARMLDSVSRDFDEQVETLNYDLAVKKPGRRDTYDDAKMVLKALFDGNKTLSSISAEKLHPFFQAKWEEIFCSRDGAIPPPAVRTLRNHLDRYHFRTNRQQ